MRQPAFIRMLFLAMALASGRAAAQDGTSPEARSETEVDTGSSLPVGPILLGGGSLAVLSLGVAFGLQADTDNDDYDKRPTEDGADDVESSALAANICLFTGGAMAIGALVWWLVDELGHDQDDETETTVGVGAAGNGGAVTVMVAF